MTIGIGLVCSDGIVIAADGEITHGLVKSQRVKLFEIRGVSEDVSLVAAGAGDEMFIDGIRERLQEQLTAEVPDIVSLKRGIEGIVVQACNEIWPLFDPANRPTIELLLALKAVDGCALLHVDGPLVRHLADVGFIGFGRDLALYKSKQLLVIPSLSVEIAAPVVIYLVKTVKDNARYCGGETSVWVLHSSGTIVTKAQGDIQKIEIAYAAFDLVCHCFMPALAVMRSPDGKSMIDQLVEISTREPISKKELEEKFRAFLEITRENVKILDKIPEPSQKALSQAH